MNSTISTFNSAEVRQIIPQAHLVIGAALVLSFICFGFSEAGADAEPAVIVHGFSGRLPSDSRADQFVGDEVVKNALPELIKSDNALASRLGFTTAADVAMGQHDIRALDPYPFLIIDLDWLQSIDLVGSPPNPVNPAGIHILSRESNWLNTAVAPGSPLLPWRFLYPIEVDGVVRSSVLVAAGAKNLDEPKWKIERIGSGNLIMKLFKIEQQVDRGQHFVMWVPALNRYYLGRIDNPTPEGTFTIKTIYPDPVFNPGENVEMSAKKAFLLLKEFEAPKINLGNPDYPPR